MASPEEVRIAILLKEMKQVADRETEYLTLKDDFNEKMDARIKECVDRHSVLQQEVWELREIVKARREEDQQAIRRASMRGRAAIYPWHQLQYVGDFMRLEGKSSYDVKAIVAAQNRKEGITIRAADIEGGVILFVIEGPEPVLTKRKHVSVRFADDKPKTIVKTEAPEIDEDELERLEELRLEEEARLQDEFHAQREEEEFMKTFEVLPPPEVPEFHKEEESPPAPPPDFDFHIQHQLNEMAEQPPEKLPDDSQVKKPDVHSWDDDGPDDFLKF